MINRACLVVILVVTGALAMTSCGGGGGGSSINVTITTDVSNIETFQTVQFAATVTGTSNTAVTWQLTCSAAGTVCGSLSATGLYVAPNTVPTVASANSTDAAVLTVTAISQANAAAGAIVQFTIDSLNQQPLTAPVQLGSSGSNVGATCGTGANEFCFGGTLGSLLTNGTTSYILSNNHVLGLSDGGTVGQDVTQPGEIETNCTTAGTITVATVSDIINLQTAPAPKVDVTTALINNGEVDATGSILELGPLATVNGVQVPQPAPPAAGSGLAATVGELLAKSGRTTGLTCATVEALDTTVEVAYEQGCATTTSFQVTYTDEIMIGDMPNGQSFIGDGDSGSLAVDEATAKPVGLLFAAGEASAVANPVADVLSALSAANAGKTFTFVGGVPHAVPGCSLSGIASSAKVTPQSAAALPAGAAQRGQTAATNNGAQIMNMKGVSAYGQSGSLDSPRDPAVMIFVAPGASHAGIPAEIDGVRTRIVGADTASVRGPVTQQQSAQFLTQSAQSQAFAVPASAVQSAIATKTKHVADLMSDPSVLAVGVGSSLDSPGDPALMIYVLKNKQHRPIPVTIDGVRTRVKETSGFHANVARPSKSTAGTGCHVPKSASTSALHAASASLQPQPLASSSGGTR
jgi:hypothetical protein